MPAKPRRCAGVRAIVTRDDLADLNPYFGTGVEDQPVVVIDKSRYVGDIVAAVAADSREIAEEAVTLIEVEYEETAGSDRHPGSGEAKAPIIHEKHVDKTAGGNIHGVYRASSGEHRARFSRIRRGHRKSLTHSRPSNTAISSPTR